MDELEALVCGHKFVPNKMRTSLRPKDESRPWGNNMLNLSITILVQGVHCER